MDARTLSQAMGGTLSLDKYAQLLPDFIFGMQAAGCTNTLRAAMYCAQVGHESVGLRYMEELASGEAYNNRRDLGNTNPGDGPRYKGRGPIQITGRHNYGVFGQWCKNYGLIGDANYFVDNPTAVAIPRWGFLAAAWYWTVARPKLNQYADAKDIQSATQAINGGLNGYADRKNRYASCLILGTLLVPAPVRTTSTQQRMFFV